MTSADPIPMLCHPFWACGELPPCELLPLGPPPGGPGGPPDEELDELPLPRGMAVAVSDHLKGPGSGDLYGLGPSGNFFGDCPGGNPAQADIASYCGVAIGIIIGG